MKAGVRRALHLGSRTLIAATCFGCGHLKSGSEFGSRPRLPNHPSYVDRRCRKCRWRKMEQINPR